MYAGDTVTVSGVVTGKRDDGDRLVDLALTMSSHDDRVICTAEVVVRLAEAT
jgi:hypothetical protein